MGLATMADIWSEQGYIKDNTEGFRSITAYVNLPEPADKFIFVRKAWLERARQSGTMNDVERASLSSTLVS